MKGKGIDLKTKYLLFFWAPALFLLVLVFLLISKKQFPVLSAVQLPQEYSQMLSQLSVKRNLPTLREEEKSSFLKENPFLNAVAKGNATTIGNTTLDSTVASSNTLTLSMILISDKKSCIINNKLYREGDKIGEIKISKIGDYYVVLTLPNKKKVYMEVGATYTY